MSVRLTEEVMRKLGLVGSLLVVSAGWHALGACTGDEPVAPSWPMGPKQKQKGD